MLAAIALVPEEAVLEAFDALTSSDFFEANEALLSPILIYFENTWVGGCDRRGRRRSPVSNSTLELLLLRFGWHRKNQQRIWRVKSGH